LKNAVNRSYVISLLTHYPYFQKIKAGLCDHHAVNVSVRLHIPPVNFTILEPIIMKPGTYITAPQPISMVYITAMQLIGKNVTTVTNTQATTEELLGTLFSMWSVPYQRKAGDQIFPELLVLYIILRNSIALTFTYRPYWTNSNRNGILRAFCVDQY
jgi:hypothetical protein